LFGFAARAFTASTFHVWKPIDKGLCPLYNVQVYPHTLVCETSARTQGAPLIALYVDILLSVQFSWMKGVMPESESVAPRLGPLRPCHLIYMRVIPCLVTPRTVRIALALTLTLTSYQGSTLMARGNYSTVPRV